jgi:hypothetical protein
VLAPARGLRRVPTQCLESSHRLLPSRGSSRRVRASHVQRGARGGPRRPESDLYVGRRGPRRESGRFKGARRASAPRHLAPALASERERTCGRGADFRARPSDHDTRAGRTEAQTLFEDVREPRGLRAARVMRGVPPSRRRSSHAAEMAHAARSRFMHRRKDWCDARSDRQRVCGCPTRQVHTLHTPCARQGLPTRRASCKGCGAPPRAIPLARSAGAVTSGPNSARNFMHSAPSGARVCLCWCRAPPALAHSSFGRRARGFPPPKAASWLAPAIVPPATFSCTGGDCRRFASRYRQ